MLQQLRDQVEINTEIINIAHDSKQASISKCMYDAWNIIAPTWPLQSYIARNPLAGLENQPFIEALITSSKYFEDLELPREMLDINRETIKWCQAIFDQEQATISIPLRGSRVFEAWLNLAKHDSRLHSRRQQTIVRLEKMPNDPLLAIKHCLDILGVSSSDYTRFFILMLVSLPGWAGYVKYLVEYSDRQLLMPIDLIDYLAVRIVIASSIWPQSAQLVSISDSPNNSRVSKLIKQVTDNEVKYTSSLLNSINLSLQDKNKFDNVQAPSAQLIFCIDVRSEPFRRAIESQGDYATFGYAGFFGVPISKVKHDTRQQIASCPVLIKPKHNICETHNCSSATLALHGFKEMIYKIFRSSFKTLKNNFTTPFILVEIMGPALALLLIYRTFLSGMALRLKKNVIDIFKTDLKLKPSKHDIEAIGLKHRCQYAKNMLLMTGLVSNFAPVVLLCGHKSFTANNPYFSALDCGACGGNKGGYNAQVMAEILNDPAIREYLASISIFIPKETVFIGAEHNTTTDEVEILSSDNYTNFTKQTLEKLSNDLYAARMQNNTYRAQTMQFAKNESNILYKIAQRSVDWSQTRPEWGLARNASFIVAPRTLTKTINLEGRSFLHSYDWRYDIDGVGLESILTAPLVVAQWINCQYLFSTASNIIYGGGSKVTQNITGKIGIIQGNSSDLMYGLPVQSVNCDDDTNYHELLRLTAIVYAPLKLISFIISKHELLQKLFCNNWVLLFAVDPITSKTYRIDNELNWQIYELP